MSKNYQFTEKSLLKLSEVHIDLQKLAINALSLSDINFSITEGLRTREKQLLLVEQGVSQTLNSRHLTGHAIDVMAWYQGKITWDWHYYELINEAFSRASVELNIPYEWGGDWKTLKDGPHFQLPYSIYK
ncbi:M15 family metallopeptidase [Enterobacter roggenkampii]|uniref:M15 family metallopeptidase n=1 Tax=Enterobacter roggenkampii TaxID=1812935 RepID=UPI002FF6C6D8